MDGRSNMKMNQHILISMTQAGKISQPKRQKQTVV